MNDPAATTDKRHARRRTFQLWLERNSVSIYALILVVLLGCVAVAPRLLVTVPAGHVGVIWMRFGGGTVTDYHYEEGIHFVMPWDEIISYDARLHNNARVYDTISSDGLRMKVEIAVRYRINRDSVGFLHKLVGPDYAQVLVYPEIGSHARELIATYTPEQLYTDARSFIQAQILERMVRDLGSSLANQSFGGKLVTVEDVLIRSVTLPDSVAEAIERKSEQYHAMLEYDYRIESEKKERERKRIEAEGVREFQDIVSHTITNEYLRLKGIEATMSLATSQNSKTIIIGGKDGLPVILNTEDPGSRMPQEPNMSRDMQAPNAAALAGDNTHPDANEPLGWTDWMSRYLPNRQTPIFTGTGVAVPEPAAPATEAPSADVSIQDETGQEDSGSVLLDRMNAVRDTVSTPTRE